MKDDYLEDLKKSNDKLRFEIADKIAKRDLEVYQLADRLATIMREVFDFCKQYTKFANSEDLRKDGPRFLFNCDEHNNIVIGVWFNKLRYEPKDDTLYFFNNLVIPTIPEWVGKYEYEGQFSKTKPSDSEIKQVLTDLRIALEDDGKCWMELAKKSIEFRLAKEHEELTKELEIVA